MGRYDKDCLIKGNLTRAEACGYSLKQITDIYLANYKEVDSALKESATFEGWEITGVTGNCTWYHIEPAKDSTSYNDDLVIGGNGSKYRTHSMTFSFNGQYDADMAEALDMLSLGRFCAILHTSDGGYIMMGRLTGLEATAASSLSEAAADGQNGITVTLECNTTEPVLPLGVGVFAKDVKDKVFGANAEG